MKRLITFCSSLSPENGSGMTRDYIGIDSARSRKLFALLFCLLFVGVGNVWGTTATWALVTSAPSDWSGEYLIVYGDGCVDGSLTSGFDQHTRISVTITNNKITLDDSYSITIAKSSTKYSLRTASGYYFGRNANSNGMDFNSSWSSNYTVVFNNWNSTNKTVQIAGNGGRCLGRNGNVWRFYSSGNAYTNVSLYKKEASAFTVTASSNNNSWGTVSVSGTTITATPADCYQVASGTDGYSLISGSASAITHASNSNTISVTPTANCSIQVVFEKQTVNTYVDEIQGNADIEDCGTHDAPTLEDEDVPGALETRCAQLHYHFMGWVTAANKANPTDDNIITPGTSMTADGATYYAVWARGNGGSLTVTQANCAAGASASGYSNKSWTATGTDGNSYSGIYRIYGNSTSASMQFNNSGIGMYTPQLPGAITSITLVKASGSDRNWTPRVSATTQQTSSSSSNGTNLTAKSVNGTVSWSVDASQNYRYLYLGVAGGASYLSSITVTWGTFSDYICTCCTQLAQINGSFSFTSVGTTGATANWGWTGATTGISKNILKVYKELDNSLVTTIDNISASATSQAITGLDPCTEYYVKLTTVSSGGGYCDGVADQTGASHVTFTTNGWGVTETLSHTTHATGESTACPASNYVATYTADLGYVLPSSVAVSIGGVAKTQGTHYTWSVSNGTGTLTVLAANITTSTGAIAINISSDAAGCSGQYTFAYGATPNADGKNIDGATLECFSRVGETNEYQVTGFTIPTTTQYYWVGYNGAFYNDGLGSNNASSSRNQFKYMPVANLQGSSCGGTGDSYKHAAAGAYGTLRIYSNYPDNNLYVGFVPAGYFMRYGTTGQNDWANIQMSQSGSVWTTDPMDLTAEFIAKKFNIRIFSGASYDANSEGIAINNWTDGGSTISSMQRKTNSGENWASGVSAGMRGFFRTWTDNCANNGYCHFVPTHRVIFHSNYPGGGGPADTYSVDVSVEETNNSIALASAPSAPTGYTFAGWYDAADGGNHITTARTISAGASADIELWAHWNANTIALTLDKNNNDASGSTSGSASVKYDNTALESGTTHATREHYTLEGYYAEAGCTHKVLTAAGALVNYTGYVESDKWVRNTTPTTLYANWTPTNYTVTWYAGGTASGNITTAGNPSTSVAYNSKVTDLPTNPDGSACDKVFVGWTDDTDYDHGTSLLFTDAAGSPAITGATNFYAVYATESVGSTTLLEEDFSEITTGNSTSTSGSSTTWDRNANFSTGANTYSAGGAVRLGSSSNTGNLTTKQLTAAIGDEITVAFKVKGWSSVEGDISVSGLYSEFTKPSDITYTAVMDGDFESKSVTVTLTKANPYIIIATTAKRAFIDDLVITKSGTTYTGHTITCADCGTSVTPTFTAAPAGGTVAVTKGGNAVASGSTVKTCTSIDLSVTITPASHYTLTGFTATGLTTGTATISPAVNTVLPTTSAQTFTVTVSASATGTLNLTPTFTEDTKVAITWNVNGVNQSIAATEGLTWVYSGGDLTALPSNPSVPAGCSGTKVFAGWSAKHSDATEEDASYYDDLFTAVGDAPTGISSEKTFYAVFATSSANPLAGTVIWDEPFTGFSANDVPTAKSTGATVYNSTVLTYACSNGSGNGTTKIYAETLAGGTSPELLVAKSGGSLTVSNIPTAGQTQLTLSYKANNALAITSGTSGVTIGDPSVSGTTYTHTITISQSPSATNNFSLVFTKSTTGNARLDDIHLIVPGSSTLTDYLTLCAPSYTITYNKNTSDAVTNLPSPTSVLQSTGSGTLSSTIPVRATYTFVGWSNASGDDNTKNYDAGGSITGVTADKTIYAVWEKTAVEELTLNYSELNKYVGDPAVTLEVTGVTPEGADASVTWSSNNSSVASVVTATGVVTFGTVGTATITATSTVTGTTTAYCYVTVRNKPTASFTDLIHDGNGTDLSTYYMQNVAGTPIVFPTLDDYATPGDDCDSKHYVFVGWTTSDNNDDPQDNLVASGELEDDQDKVFYAVWADGVEGVSYTQLTTSTFKTSPTKYVIGAIDGDDTFYFNSCAATDANNGNGGCTNAPGTNAPIQFTLSGTADALVATSTEATARYLTPLTAKNFQMSATSKTIQLNDDGTIANPSDESWTLRFNTSEDYLRWYSSATGNAAYFYEVTAGAAVSYRTSCCTNNVPAPTVIATNTAYTVTLTWAAVDGATGYEVSWNGGAFEAATSPCVKSGLTASTDYIYKVRATYNPLVKCGALVASGSVTTDDVYSVTYSGGTGTGSCSPSGSVAPASYEAGATVTLAPTNSFSLTSNTFAAWVVKDADDNDVPVSNNQFTMPAKNVTVTATWTAVQDKYYDRMHDGTDASHGGIPDGEGKYYLVLEGCNYTVPTLTDDDDGDTDCHTTHYKLLGWIAYSHLKTDGSGQIKPGEESYIFQGGGTKSATGATYYAIWAIMTE